MKKEKKMTSKSHSTCSTRFGRRKLNEALEFAEQNAEFDVDLSVANVNKGRRIVPNDDPEIILQVTPRQKKSKKQAKKGKNTNSDTEEQKIESKRGKRKIPFEDAGVATESEATANMKRVEKTHTIFANGASTNDRRKTATEVDFVEDGDRVLMAVNGQDEENFGIDSSEFDQVHEGRSTLGHSEESDSQFSEVEDQMDDHEDHESHSRDAQNGSQKETIHNLSQEEKKTKNKAN